MESLTIDDYVHCDKKNIFRIIPGSKFIVTDRVENESHDAGLHKYISYCFENGLIPDNPCFYLEMRKIREREQASKLKMLPKI